eukprot:759977-Hanusia_phi.AAC.7
MKLANRMLQPDTRKDCLHRQMTSSFISRGHQGRMDWASCLIRLLLELTSQKVEDDRILFPGDATFTYVEQARNNAKNSRVYVLKFVDSNEKMFFWMQEPKADKDDDFVRRVNAKLNPDGAAQAAPVDLGQMDQQQLLSLLSGESPAAAPSLDNPSAGQQPSADVEMSETEIHNSAQASNTSEGSGNVTAPQVGGISSANLSQILSNLGSGQTASGQNLNLSNLAAAQVRRQMLCANTLTLLKAANMYSGPNLEDVLEPRSVIQALEDCPDLKANRTCPIANIC